MIFLKIKYNLYISNFWKRNFGRFILKIKIE